MKLTPVKDLGNDELVNEFYGIGQMAGGDLSLSPRYCLRRESARREILRRMERSNSSLTTATKDKT